MKRQRIHPRQTLLLCKDTALTIHFTSERSILQKELRKLEQRESPIPPSDPAQSRSVGRCQKYHGPNGSHTTQKSAQCS